METTTIKLFSEFEQQIQSSIQKFNVITINDDDSLVVAETAHKEIKNVFDQIETHRKTLVKPLNDELDHINGASKLIVKPLMDARETLGSKILVYKKEKEQKRLVELQKIEAEKLKEKAIIDSINDFKIKGLTMLNSAKMENIDILISKLESYNPNPASFGNHLNICIETRDELLKLSKDRKKAMIEFGEQNAVAVEMKETKIEISEPVKSKEIELKNDKITGIRKTWKFNVVDELLIPREFLMVDESKIRAFMSDYKKTISKGESKIPGIEFYQDEKVS